MPVSGWVRTRIQESSPPHNSRARATGIRSEALNERKVRVLRAASSSSSDSTGTVTTTDARMPRASAGTASVTPSISRSQTTSARTWSMVLVSPSRPRIVLAIAVARPKIACSSTCEVHTAAAGPCRRGRVRPPPAGSAPLPGNAPRGSRTAPSRSVRMARRNVPTGSASARGHGSSWAPRRAGPVPACPPRRPGSRRASASSAPRSASRSAPGYGCTRASASTIMRPGGVLRHPHRCGQLQTGSDRSTMSATPAPRPCASARSSRRIASTRTSRWAANTDSIVRPRAQGRRRREPGADGCRNPPRGTRSGSRRFELGIR